MKRGSLLIKAVLMSCLVTPALAVEFQDPAAVLAVDFNAGWENSKSDDPAVVLKLVKGDSSFEFTKLDSELSEYYLKARVKEQVDVLRSKGNTLEGEILPAGIHGVSTAYYTAYESMGTPAYMAFFTYNGVSYAVSAKGLGDVEFKNVIFTIRKPGEVVELPKPKKVVRAVKKKKPEPQGGVESVMAAVAADSATVVAVGGGGSDTVAAVTESTGPSAGQQVLDHAGDLLARMELKKDPSKIPYVRRNPLNFKVWGVLIGIWFIGSLFARYRAAKFVNPKLSPSPQDVPPDFFFPFIISRVSNIGDCAYNVVTRQKQLLAAYFTFEHEIYIAGSVYAGVFFHILWSLLDMLGHGGIVTGALLAPPGGRLWASAPEMFLLVPLAVGAHKYFTRVQALQLFDAQSNLMMEAKKEVFYCLIRDGKGKEVARVMKRGGIMERAWDFVDTDNLIVFTVKDDCPVIYILRKLFGNLGGTLRSRYGIFAAERRAGFVFLDPASADGFQLHLDFDFARLAQPAQMLTCVLYIISKEKDPVYPSPF